MNVDPLKMEIDELREQNERLERDYRVVVDDLRDCRQKLEHALGRLADRDRLPKIESLPDPDPTFELSTASPERIRARLEYAARLAIEQGGELERLREKNAELLRRHRGRPLTWPEALLAMREGAVCRLRVSARRRGLALVARFRAWDRRSGILLTGHLDLEHKWVEWYQWRDDREDLDNDDLSGLWDVVGRYRDDEPTPGDTRDFLPSPVDRTLWEDPS